MTLTEGYMRGMKKGEIVCSTSNHNKPTGAPPAPQPSGKKPPLHAMKKLKHHFIPYIEDTVFDDKGAFFKRAMASIGAMEIKWDGKFVFYVQKVDDVVQIKTKFGRWLSSVEEIKEAYDTRAPGLVDKLSLLHNNIQADNIQKNFKYMCDFMCTKNDVDKHTNIFTANTTIYQLPQKYVDLGYEIVVSINTLFINDVMMCPSDYQKETKIFSDNVLVMNDMVSLKFEKNPQYFRLFILESDFNGGSIFNPYNVKPSWKLLLVKFLNHSYITDTPRTIDNMLEYLGKDASKPFRKFFIANAEWIDQFFEFVWDKHIMYIKKLMLEFLDNSLTDKSIFVSHREGYVIKDYAGQEVYKLVDRSDFMKHNRIKHNKGEK